MNNYTHRPPQGFGYIYLLRSPSLKCYVGQTIRSVKHRVAHHSYRKHCHAIHSAIKKYGIENFSIGVLGCYPISELNSEEVKAIAKWNSLTPNGYNLNTGGQAKHTFSEETRKRMSIAQRGKKKPPRTKEHCQHLSDSQKGRVNIGKHPTEETRLKLSEAAMGNKRGKGYCPTQEQRISASVRMKGNQRSKGNKQSEESKLKIGFASKGRRHSEATKIKLSKIAIARCAKKKLECIPC